MPPRLPHTHAPPIVSTDEWGASPAARAFPLNHARGVVLHNTASPNRAPKSGAAELAEAYDLARNIQADHVIRGYEDTGNHFTISRGGVILEGRHGSSEAAALGLVPTGAHAGNLEANTYHHGIELEGTYTGAEPITAAQWRALVRLTDYLLTAAQLPASAITPHRAWRETGCPGHVADRIPELARAVRLRRALRAGAALGGAVLLMALARHLASR